MDHNDGQDDVKDEGMAKTAYKTNGQRCPMVFSIRTDGNVSKSDAIFRLSCMKLHTHNMSTQTNNSTFEAMLHSY